MNFEKYPIAAEIKRNLAEMGFKKPTDIQYKAIPSIMNREDVLAVAQTGTGKTAAFAIPIINDIHKNKSSKRTYGISCIVMVPTRELAMQIGGVFTKLARHTRVKVFAMHGGVEQDPQIKKLEDGLDILVTTPGRMFDLIHQKHINLKRIRTLVIDEADRMLDLGFIEDIQFIKKMLRQKHQTLFFSATINREIKKLAYSQVKSSAVRIQISPEDPVSKNVTHYVMYVEMDDKRFFLKEFVAENPDSRIIVFVRTRVRAERVARAMERFEIPTLTIHGEKEQDDRSDVMKQFRDGACDMLIATDVSARGIDIPDVNFVVNYDMPDIAENYVHRVGRTGRGFNKGVAISFCSEEEKALLDEIQRLLNKEIAVLRVSNKDYAETIQPLREDDPLKALMEEHEAWEKKKRKKKKKKKPSK